MKEKIKEGVYSFLTFIFGYLVARYVGFFDERQSIVFAILAGIIYLIYDDLNKKIQNEK